MAFVFKEIFSAHFRCDLRLCKGAPAQTIAYQGTPRDGVFMELASAMEKDLPHVVCKIGTRTETKLRKPTLPHTQTLHQQHAAELFEHCAAKQARPKSMTVSEIPKVESYSFWVNKVEECSRQKGRQTDRQTDRPTKRQTDRQADREADRQTDRVGVRHTDRQTDRQTDRVGVRHTPCAIIIKI